MTSGKIGVGVITCDREGMLSVCVDSILSLYGDSVYCFVVNDGENTPRLPQGVEILNNSANLGVGKSKNKAIKHMIDNECEHIFVVEDDIMFVSDRCLSSYIELSNLSGVKHFNYCLHGEYNKTNDTPTPKLIVDYKTAKMSLYGDVTGAMSYYHSSVIESCGYMSDDYKNAMEHVDHTMRIIEAGFHPPFRWFADVADSHTLIKDQDSKLTQSKIRKSDDWMDNFRHGVRLFKDKYNIDVCDPGQRYKSKNDVVSYLRSLK